MGGLLRGLGESGIGVHVLLEGIDADAVDHVDEAFGLVTQAEVGLISRSTTPGTWSRANGADDRPRAAAARGFDVAAAAPFWRPPIVT